MDELEKIYEKLNSIEKLYGYTGVAIGIFIIIIGFLAWRYLKSYTENYAKSFFNQSLAYTQASLIDDIGKKFIIQRGEFEKEITSLKGEIDKEISSVQSKLGLITGQQTNFLNERRKSLLELYTSHVEWAGTVMDKASSDIDEDNLNLRKEMIIEMDKLKHKFNITSASYQIYGRDAVLNDIMAELLMETARLQTLKEKQLFETELLYKERIQLSKEVKQSTYQTEDYESLRIKLKENSEQVICKTREIEKELIAKYKEISLNQSKASKRISELIKESFEKR